MAKVTEIKKNAGQQAYKHDRHAYQELTAVASGYTKANKEGVEDKSKVYTTLFCPICGGTKEVVAASGLPVEKEVSRLEAFMAEEDKDIEESESKTV